ncbi:MAG TPA: class I SAM-dependent methyltransferase [Pyrinomonadaceae bacterium]
MEALNLLDHPICFSFPQRLAPSAWLGHVPFAMFAIDMLRPSKVVELGTHYGVSYCAFCQGVKEVGLEASCYAVDSWEGDPHGGCSGREILEDLQRYHDPLYGAFSRLIHSSFDEAVSYFDDHSIDLLHIDGYHTYEAVRHDFETWLPKLSDRGVVLFHDINVRERDFGVWKFWSELKTEYPSFEFLHSHGLGLLAVGSQQPKLLRQLIATQGQELIRIREGFYQLGMRLERILDLQRLNEDSQRSTIASLASLREQIELRDQQLVEQQQAKEAAVQDLQQRVQEVERQEAAVRDLQQQLNNRDASELQLRELLNSTEQQFQEQKLQLEAQVAANGEQLEQLHATERQLASQQQLLTEKDQQFTTQQQQLQEAQEKLIALVAKLRIKEAGFESLQQELVAAREMVATKNLQLREQERQLAEQIQETLIKERLLSQVNSELEVLKETVNTVTATVNTVTQQLQEAQHQSQATERQLQDSQQRFQEVQRLGQQAERQLREKEARVQELLTSRALRIGSTLTWPAKKFRYSRFNFIRSTSNGRQNGNGVSVVSPVLIARSALSGRSPSLGGQLALGIVTYNNTSQQLNQLARSIEIAAGRLEPAGIDLRILIIDNGNECAWPDLSIPTTRLETRGNIGFGRAMNLLMAEFFADPQAEAFLCINPDGVLHSSALAELLFSYEDHPASLIEARQFPEEHTKSYDPQTLDTPWASGACLLIPRNIYTAIGGFDPNFFMYLEDIDLSWRARVAGFNVKVSPNALFGHAVLNRKPSEQTEKLFFLSGRYLAHKWRNSKFVRWAEEGLVSRGHFASVAALPVLPEENFSIAGLKPEVPDFEHYFHFSSARW